MKNNLFKVVLVALFAIVASYSVNKMQTQTTEALADHALRGCVNGPNCWGYCVIDGGIYSCEDFWIWNCVTVVN